MKISKLIHLYYLPCNGSKVSIKSSRVGCKGHRLGCMKSAKLAPRAIESHFAYNKFKLLIQK